MSRTGPPPDPQVAALAAEYLTRWAEQTFTHQARAAEPVFRRALRATEAAGRAAPTSLQARGCVGLAETLIEMGEHAEAIELATRARRMADRAGDADLAARALLALGRAENDAGNLRRARTLLGAARDRFESAGDLRGQGWALHRLSETWEWADLEREVADLRAAYALFAKARDRFGRAVVANDIAYILSVEGGRQFHTWYEQARRLVEDDGDLRSRASLLRTWASYCCSAGRFRDAMAAAQSCRPLAAEAGDRYTEADALLIAAQAGVRSGDPEPIGSLAREAAAIGTALRSVRIQTLARLATARVEVRRGRPDAGARALRQARSSISEHGIRVMHGDLAETEAMLALDRGQWDRAGACAEDLRTALAAVPMRLWSAVPDLMAGRALLGAGRPDEALPLLRRAAEEGSRSDAAGAAALAAACAGQAAVLCGALDGHRRPAAPADAPTTTVTSTRRSPRSPPRPRASRRCGATTPARRCPRWTTRCGTGSRSGSPCGWPARCRCARTRCGRPGTVRRRRPR